MSTAIANPVGTAATAASAPASGTLASPEGSEDRFLRLLVAQMKHQDPLNPLDNAQVTSQMAQISTVNGIDKLNATLQKLSGGFGEMQSLQAAALIGRDVLVTGNALDLGAGGAIGGFDLKESADRVSLEIKDAAGTVVHRADLGAQNAGVHNFAWDGVNDAGTVSAPGRYTFSVSAVRSNAAVSVDTLAATRVLAISRDSAGTSLELSGMGLRPYADVKQII